MMENKENVTRFDPGRIGDGDGKMTSRSAGQLDGYKRVISRGKQNWKNLSTYKTMMKTG